MDKIFIKTEKTRKGYKIFCHTPRSKFGFTILVAPRHMTLENASFIFLRMTSKILA